MEQITFEGDEASQNSKILQEQRIEAPQSFVSKLVMKTGIVKNPKHLNLVLIIISILFLLLTFGVIFFFIL
jgi:hypothetical protein